MKGHQSINYVETFYIRQLIDSHNNSFMPLVRASLHCFFYLKQGEANIAIGDKTYIIKPREVLIVPQGQVFSVKTYKDCQGYMGGFHNNFLISNSENDNNLNRFEFLKELSNPKTSFEEIPSNYIETIFDRIFFEFTSKTIDKEIIKSYLFCLLNEINKVQAKLPINKPSRQEEVCNKFKELITLNLRENLSLSDYASKLNLTVNHLNKTIKQITGKNSSKLIDEAIVTEAKIMLYQSNLSITEIAQDLKIYDNSYFSRLFKKSEGITPSEFRKRN